MKNKINTKRTLIAPLPPLARYPVRTGTRERPSFMISIDLKSGTVDSDFWVKRGTALLLALAS